MYIVHGVGKLTEILGCFHQFAINVPRSQKSDSKFVSVLIRKVIQAFEHFEKMPFFAILSFWIRDVV